MNQNGHQLIGVLFVWAITFFINPTSAQAINFNFSIGANGSLATGSFSATDSAWADQTIDITEVTSLVVTNHLYPPGEFTLSSLTDNLQEFSYMAGNILQFYISEFGDQSSYVRLLGTVYNADNGGVRVKSMAGPVNAEPTTVVTNPEPSTILLLVTGLGILAWRARHRLAFQRGFPHHA